MSSLLNLFLAIPSFVYKTVALADWLLKRARQTRFDGLFIISVDNLCFGGSGKTSMVSHLAAELERRNLPFAIVSRGYKSSVRSGCREVDQNDTPIITGDEPLMLKRRFQGSVVIIGPDRITALKRLQQTSIRHVILDDGFQSAHIHKNVRILLESRKTAGYYYRIFRFMGRHSDLRLYRHEQSDVPGFYQTPELSYRFRHTGLFNASGVRVDPADLGLIAFAALGDNNRFFDDLRRYRIQTVHPFPDHHFFTPSDIEALKESMRQNKARYCVCTPKDFVKLPKSVRADDAFLYAENGIEFNFDLIARLTALGMFCETHSTSP